MAEVEWIEGRSYGLREAKEGVVDREYGECFRLIDESDRAQRVGFTT